MSFSTASLSLNAASEELLETLLDISLNGVNLLRPLYGPTGELEDFAPEYFNPAAQRMTGLPERPDGTARTLFPDIFTNGIFDFYRRVFETGQAGRFELYYQADGLDNYFHVAARRSGELLVVSFTDTSDQSRTPVEEALRRSQAAEKVARAEAERQRQRFYEVLMALPAQVATYQGPDHVYHFVNAAYQRYFPTQALPDRALREVLPEAEAQGVLVLMDRVYQTGEPSYQQELEVWLDFSGSGQPRQLFLNLFFHPLRDAAGRVDGLLDFSYDVTEQVLARRQVQTLNDELESQVSERTGELAATNEELGMTNAYLTRSNVDLDNFIYTASHDLKAPITNIEGLMQNLWRTLPSDILAIERVGRIRTLMQDSVERFKRTIASLTEVVKLQKENSGEAVLMELPAVVQAVLLDLEPMIQSSQAQLIIDIAACPAVRFSEKNLRSVVYNLVSNAIKYRSPERVPSVQIACQTMDWYHMLSVTDNGLGMESGRLNQLFTMFRRFHDHVEGSGIGLYMIKKMVENAGGKIEVESHLGEGSTFRVYFPR